MKNKNLTLKNKKTKKRKTIADIIKSKSLRISAVKETFKVLKQYSKSSTLTYRQKPFAAKKLSNLIQKGVWQKMTPKMKGEFFRNENWTITKTTRGVKTISFKKEKSYIGAIKGIEKNKRLRTIAGLNEVVKAYNSLFEKYSATRKNEKEPFTPQQQKQLRKLKNQLLWSQLQNANTIQRKETLKKQIEIFKENIFETPTSTGTAERINIYEYIISYKQNVLDEFRDLFKEYAGREGDDTEIVSVFMDEIVAKSGLSNLKRGKNVIQADAYWDDTRNLIVYLSNL